MKFKNELKRIWHFIWEEDSILSWIVNIIIAFIIVKFIIYPGLGLALGTTHPVVAVVSSSMEHEVEGFDFWWYSNKDFYIKKEIKKEDFEKYKFKNGFNKGDLMVLKRARDIKKGDIIVFRGDAKEPIIHRAVDISNGTYQTKGDNGKTNKQSRPDEIEITEDRLVGKAIFRIPYLGWIKLIFVEIINEALR